MPRMANEQMFASDLKNRLALPGSPTEKPSSPSYGRKAEYLGVNRSGDFYVQVTCSESFKGAYHLCGIFGTLSLIMVNSVSNAALREDTGGRLGPGGARVWLFIGFVMGFAAIIAACWILFADFVTKNSPKNPSSEWAGSGLFLQNCFIFIASLVYKFGRVEDNF